MKCLISVLIVTLIFSSQIYAGDYWVVGSYTDSETAKKGKNRLSSLTGAAVEISEFVIKGTTYHRLLVSDQAFNDQVLASLESVGILPWYLSTVLSDQPQVVMPKESATAENTTGSQGKEGMTSDKATEKTESIDPEYAKLGPGQAFFVAESSTEVEKALDTERKLADAFLEVRGQTALIDGQVLHRVLVGPLAQTDIAGARIKLNSLGYVDVFLINVENDVLIEDTVLPIVRLPAQIEARRKAVSRTREAQKPQARHPSGYNLARLPKKNPTFRN